MLALWTVNRKVYGAHKLWKAARRAGHDIGRDQVARLMNKAGIEGVKRTKRVRPSPTVLPSAPPIWSTVFSPPTLPTACGPWT